MNIKTCKPALVVIAVILFVLAALLFGIGIGSIFITPGEIFEIIMKKFTGQTASDSVSAVNVSILWNVRLPRALCAFVVGAGLSVGGAVLQSVLANPLASGYTLGVSAGASVGLTVLIMFGSTIPIINTIGLPFAAFITGFLTVVAVLLISSGVSRNTDNVTVILMGMVMSLFMSAVVTLLMGLKKEAAQRVIYWQMGSFSGKDFDVLAVLFPVTLIAILLIMRYSRAMDVMTFGDEQALSTGVNVKSVKSVLLALAAVLTGVSVAYAGIIGFIDLIVPHTVRRLFGAKHITVIPMSALVGGGFTVLCDLIARTVIAPIELPVGAVTAIIGAPIFAYIFLKRSKNA
jgi:iron complex transport system permease protein